MASKRKVQRQKTRAGFLAKTSLVFLCALVIALFAGSGIASADRNTSNGSLGLKDGLTFSGTVGLDSLLAAPVDESTSAQSDILSLTERPSLTIASYCDISTDLEAIDARLEEERRAAEEARRIEEQKKIDAATAAQEKYASVNATSLPAVDFSVGKEVFIDEWTGRIDAYLAGSPLAGYGSVFAAAAWEYGVDPRWSPAISNTESSKGSICFLPYNAWGWGSSSWSNWTDAIWAHVRGLSVGYGYSITQAAAEKYCPPNSVNWYNNTVSEMARI